MAKLILDNGVELEGTIEEIKEFIENNKDLKESNVLTISDYDNVTTNNNCDTSTQNIKEHDVVEFLDDFDSIIPTHFFFAFDDKNNFKKGDRGCVINVDGEYLVHAAENLFVAELEDVRDIVKVVGSISDDNPLNLYEGERYFLSSYKGESIERELILENIDKTSYLFVDEEDENDAYYISFCYIEEGDIKKL